MITNNFTFHGALGRANDVGGSKCFSIPHTIDVPVQYHINTNVIGDFISCSLNGRLWLFKRSTRLTFYALKWNKETLKLEFAASIAKSGETFLARGLDWLLTDKSFVYVLDDEPYIYTVSFSETISLDENFSLYDDKSIRQFCSLLPNVGYTNPDDTNSDDADLYDFQIVHNLLIKRNDLSDNAENHDSNEIIHYSIPLEFPLDIHFNLFWPEDFGKINYSGDLDFFFQFNALSCHNAHIIAHNAALWGRGSRSLGQVFILPAVFNLDGSVLHYFLYFQNVSNDFNLLNFSKDKNIAIAFCGEKLYGFDFDAYRHFCAVSKDDYVFTLENDDWVSLSDPDSSSDPNSPSDDNYKAKVFFDTSTSRALMLDHKGITFLGYDTSQDDTDHTSENDQYQNYKSLLEANHFHLWVAPADKILALDQSLIVASDDLSTFVTHPDSSFFREYMRNKILPISANSSLDQRFSISLSKENNKNILLVNQSTLKDVQKPVLWNDTYKHAVDFEFVTSLRNVNIHNFVPYILGDKVEGGIITYNCRFCNMMTPFFLPSEPRVNVYQEWGTAQYTTKVAFELCYFDPLDGSLHGPITLSVAPPLVFSTYTYSNGNTYEYISKAFKSRLIPSSATFCIFKNQIGIAGFLYERNSPYESFSVTSTFIPMFTIPDELLMWCNPPQYSHLALDYGFYDDNVLGCEGIFSNGLRFQSNSVDDILNDEALSTAHAVFFESSTHTPFAIDVSNIINPQSVAKNIKKTNGPTSFSHDNIRRDYIDFASLSDNSVLDDYGKPNFVITKNGENKYGQIKFLHNLHFLAINNNPNPYDPVYIYDIHIFRSKLHNDIFDFDAEFERSSSS